VFLQFSVWVFFFQQLNALFILCFFFLIFSEYRRTNSKEFKDKEKETILDKFGYFLCNIPKNISLLNLSISLMYHFFGLWFILGREYTSMSKSKFNFYILQSMVLPILFLIISLTKEQHNYLMQTTLTYIGNINP